VVLYDGRILLTLGIHCNWLCTVHTKVQ